MSRIESAGEIKLDKFHMEEGETVRHNSVTSPHPRKCAERERERVNNRAKENNKSQPIFRKGSTNNL
ncbi:MAG: hypothetical protein MUO34_14165 [Ignavibacteriaceae bacterium]|nr:hypothetical protein [Ignavibacteriaceae bacterium]